MNEEEVDPPADLAIERTELALERTQLAWIRTTLAIIASGVAIDKLTEAFHRMRLESGAALVERGHLAGLVLSGTGTVLLLAATYYYWRRGEELKRMRGKGVQWSIPALLASLIIGILGAAVFIVLWVT